ncbi:MAG: restriction endonuclease subunit S, partial [Candidatus Helarchaeota archaeon]
MDLNEEQKNKFITSKGWVQTKLDNIVIFFKGKKPNRLGQKSPSMNIPYINIRAFEQKKFKNYTDGSSCELCNKEDVLIVWDGARCGLVGRGVSGAVGSTLAKLKCYEMDKSYLFYFLYTKYEDVNKRPKGVGIPHIDPNFFWNINIPLPPLPEQHRIVAKIEELFARLDAGVEALKKIKTQLKRYRESVLKYAFEGKLTEEWRKMHEGELEHASVILGKIVEERKNKL